MAALMRSGLKINISESYVLLQQVRGSRYNPHYVEPIVQKDLQDQVFQSDLSTELSFKPIKAAKAQVSSSVLYDDIMAKFINILMRKGDKALATDLVQKTFYAIKRIQFKKYYASSPDEAKEIDKNPLTIFHKAVFNSQPALELSAIKRGGITYQVPVPIVQQRARFLAMKWLIEAGNEKDKNARFCDQMAKELIDAAANQGRVIKRKQELHRKAEANKAYAHYRWS